jgi:hypothetical protein
MKYDAYVFFLFLEQSSDRVDPIHTESMEAGIVDFGSTFLQHGFIRLYPEQGTLSNEQEKKRIL